MKLFKISTMIVIFKILFYIYLYEFGLKSELKIFQVIRPNAMFAFNIIGHPKIFLQNLGSKDDQVFR